MMPIPQIVASIRPAARDATPYERAKLIQDVLQEVYDAIKFDTPDGTHNGGAGDEQQAVGDLLSAAIAYADVARRDELRAEGRL